MGLVVFLAIFNYPVSIVWHFHDPNYFQLPSQYNVEFPWSQPFSTTRSVQCGISMIPTIFNYPVSTVHGIFMIPTIFNYPVSAVWHFHDPNHSQLPSQYNVEFPWFQPFSTTQSVQCGISMIPTIFNYPVSIVWHFHDSNHYQLPSQYSVEFPWYQPFSTTQSV